MISEIVSKKLCTGCGACVNICNHNAIKITEDKYGFLTPVIELSKCINCGLCDKVCPINSSKLSSPIEVYAAKWNSPNIKKCASGGMFGVMATEVIQQNGIVFGCSLKNNLGEFYPIIKSVSNLKDLHFLFGSKYIQSDTLVTYTEVRNLLKENRLILFSGTPCQIAGLKGFLKNKDYPNLITIDIICHGTPNAKIFQSYISYIEKKRNIKIIDYVFRDKKQGWGNYYYNYTYVDKYSRIKHKTKKYTHSIYYKLFISSAINRDSCYKCKFATSKRVSDITIGDFWGIMKEYPEFVKDKSMLSNGISCILVNSKKGKLFWDQIKNNCTYYNVEYNNIIKHNHQLMYPSKVNCYRKDYLNSFVNGGYNKMVITYYSKEWKSIFLSLLLLLIPNCIKRIIKKIIK